MKKLLAVVVTGAMMLMAVGCTKSSLGPAEAGAPTIPSAATMQIPQLGQDAGALSKATVNDTIAYSLAKIAVVYWTLTVEGALAAPVALFKIARLMKPTKLSDNSGWQWVIPPTKDGFTATLVGRVAQDSVRWSMSVTGGALTNFIWFEGTATITGTNGYWTFHDTTSLHPALVRFTYNISAAYYGDITATVVDPANAHYQSYLKWTSSGTTKYFDGFDSAKNEQYRISWDSVTEAGYVMNVTNGNKACWDTKANNHRDIPCLP
jgi:hypothetical protein